MNHFILLLAGIQLNILTKYPETIRYFKAFAPKDSVHCLAVSDCDDPILTCNDITANIFIPEKDWQEYKSWGIIDCPHSEYSLLTEYCSDAILKYDCVIVHATAIRWRNHAYLICAASGTGKSTQTRWLQELCPGDFKVICGDRPILSFEESSISVFPSPWNGKENWHGADSAPIAGLILLERGEENKLVSLTTKEAILPMYTHFIHSAWDMDNIRKVAELETRLLQAVPTWKLTSHDVPASTKLLLESVFE